MCRPFPLGSVTRCPPKQLFPDGASLPDTIRWLETHFWTENRLHKTTNVVAEVFGEGSFRQKLAAAILNIHSRTLLGSPMNFIDLLSVYYYRRLQIDVARHQCMLAYCRASWNAPCKYELPEKEIATQLIQNDANLRVRPRQTNLPDDAWNKNTHLDLLVSSGVNVQANQHHPHGSHKGLLYPVK